MIGTGVLLKMKHIHHLIVENVEAWRDDKLINADYYKELAKLTDKSIAEYYASKTRWDNYTGD